MGYPDGLPLQSKEMGWDRTLRVWEAQTGQELLCIPAPVKDLKSGSVSISPDGLWLAGGFSDRTVRVWDARTGAERTVFKGHTDVVHSVVFSPDGKRLASASADRTIRLWDATISAAPSAPTANAP